MTNSDIDLRLGDLLREPERPADVEFAARVTTAAAIDLQIRLIRRRERLRALTDCFVAIVVGASFYLLSQAQAAPPTGRISLHGPAMAGLAMLAMWAFVTLYGAGDRIVRLR